MHEDRRRGDSGWKGSDSKKDRVLADVVAESEEFERRAATETAPTRRASGALKVLFAILLPLAIWVQFGSPPWLSDPALVLSGRTKSLDLQHDSTEPISRLLDPGDMAPDGDALGFLQEPRPR